MHSRSRSARDCVLLALAAAVLGIVIAASVESWGITRARDAIAGFQHRDVALVGAADRMHDNLLQLRRFEKDVFINIEAAQARETYRARWAAAFFDLRLDLTHVRSLAPRSMDGRVQKFVESVAAYRSAFTHTYD